MFKIKELNIRDYWKVILILFPSTYTGIGVALFQVFSSDYKEFLTPFQNPIISSLMVPVVSLVVTALILAVFYLEVISSRKLNIRAFSPVYDSGRE